MQSDDDRAERQTVPKPDDFDGNRLKFAESLAEEFTRLAIIHEAPGGTRDQRNRHTQHSYLLFLFYRRNAESYDVFRAHEYFRDLKRKPHDGNIARSVLIFTMRAKGNKQRLNRVYKLWPVFEHFHAEGVSADHFGALLKERGGADCIYEQLCAEKKIRRVNFAAEYEVDDAESAPVEIVAFEPPNSATQDGHEQSDNTGGIVLSISGEDAPADDPGSRELAAMPRAVNDQPNDVKGEAERTGPPKKVPLLECDPEKEVVIEMEEPHQVGLVLHSIGGLVSFRVFPRDGRNHYRVMGRIVSLDNQNEGQSSDDANEPTDSA